MNFNPDVAVVIFMKKQFYTKTMVLRRYYAGNVFYKFIVF